MGSRGRAPRAAGDRQAAVGGGEECPGPVDPQGQAFWKRTEVRNERRAPAHVPRRQGGKRKLACRPAGLPRTARTASWDEQHLRETPGSLVASGSRAERRTEPPVPSVVSGFGRTEERFLC